MPKQDPDPQPDRSRPMIETRYHSPITGKVIVIRSYVRETEEYDLHKLARALLDAARTKRPSEEPDKSDDNAT